MCVPCLASEHHLDRYKKTRNDGERGDLTVKIEPEFSSGGSASILEINELEDDTWHTEAPAPIAERCVFCDSVTFFPISKSLRKEQSREFPQRIFFDLNPRRHVNAFEGKFRSSL